MLFSYGRTGIDGECLGEGYNVHIDSTGQICLAIARSDNIWETVISNTKVSPNTWYHIAATYNLDSMRLFVNGDFAGVRAFSGPVYPSSINARIGSSSTDGLNSVLHFSGCIDNMRIFGYPLDFSEIDQNFIQEQPEQLTAFEINVGVKNTYTKPGADVWIPVYLTNHEKYLINSVSFTMNFDTTMATFDTAIIDSGLARNWQLFGWNDAAKNKVAFSLGGLQAQAIAYGQGELVRCRFSIKPSVKSGDNSLLLIKNLSIDEGNNLVSPTVTSGRIIIGTSPSYGDVSGNGEVTVFDAGKILQYVVGSLFLPDKDVPNFTFNVADVSGNGSISSYDAALVFQYGLALIMQFPVERMGKSSKHASKSLVTLSFDTETGSGGETIYFLSGSNLDGFLAGEFALEYDPSMISVLNGDITTDIQGATIKSRVDSDSQEIRIAVMTSDDIDSDNPINLFRIVLPPSANPASAVTLNKALLNEGAIMSNYPSDGLRNENDISTIERLRVFEKNRISVNNNVIMISNLSGVAVSVSVFDMRGRRALNREYGKTSGAIRIDAKAMPAGMYVCRISIDGKLKNIPIIFNK
jgi:hypothetical protein